MDGMNIKKIKNNKMGQSLRKRQVKVWRKNHPNKVKNQKMVTANIDLLRKLRSKCKIWFKL